MKKGFLRKLLRILSLVFFIYGIVCVYFYFQQDRFLFFPHPPIQADQKNQILLAFPRSEYKIQTLDQKTLQGWFVENGPEKSPLLIYYGGNAEDVSMQVQDLPPLQNMHFLFMNYRGYGESEGKPSQKDFFRDALQIYDEVSQRPEVDSENIFLMGRSLGSGVAMYVASERAAKGIILVTPFDSIQKVAEYYYPFLPLSLILKHPFDSVTLAQHMQIPMLAILAEKDEVIPLERAFELVRQYAGPKTLFLIPTAGHNDVQEYPQYWKEIQNFITAYLN